MFKGLGALISGFDRFTVLMEDNNNLLDDAVEILTSIDKKVGKSSGSKLKISASKGSGKEFNQMFSGIGELVKILGGADNKKVDSVIDSIVKGIGNLNDESKEFNANAKEFNANIVGLGMAILKFAFAAAIATPLILIGIPAMLLVGGAVYLLGKLFEEIDVKKFQEGTQGLEHLGKAMLFLGVGFLVFKMVDISDIVKGTLAISLVGGAMILLNKLGGGGKEMQESAKAFVFAGAAVAAIGLGIFIFQALNIDIGSIFSVALAVVVIGGGFAIIGKFDKPIKKGSLAMIFASLSILAIGGSIYAFQKMNIKVAEVFTVALTVVVIGAAFGIAGIFAKAIAKGALVMILSGIAVGIIGFSMKLFAESLAVAQGAAGMGGWEFLGFVSATVAAIGVEMGLAGLAAPFIAAGAAAMILAGGAIYIIAEALKKFASVKFGPEESKQLTFALGAVKLAFMGPPKKEGGLWEGFKGMIGGALDSGKMIATAAGYAAAGGALILVAKGLKAFKGVDFTEEDSAKMALALSSITAAFAQAGGEAANPGGLMGAVFGNTFSPNATEKGIDSVMDAGEALTGIAEGLIAFQELVDAEVDFDVLGQAISTTIGFINTAFAEIGSGEPVAQGGFLGSLFDIKQSAVEEGIDSVMNAGDALTGIAKGLTAFQALVEAEVDFDKVGKAISTTIGFIREAFAAVGGAEKVEAGGFWGSLLGIKENAVQEGIKSVSGAGKELDLIASSLTKFQAMIEKDINWSALGRAISRSIGFVQEAFAAIGRKKKVKKGGFWGTLFAIEENPVKEGIDKVKGAGAELEKIAKGLEVFQSIDLKKTEDAIKMVFGSIFKLFDVSANKNIDQQMKYLGYFAWDIKNIGESASGMESVADSLYDMSESMGIFKTEINGIDLEKLTIMDQMFCNLQKLAEIDTGLENLSSNISESLDAGFSRLGEFLEELNSTTSESGSGITDKLQGLGEIFMGGNDDSEEDSNGMVVKLDPAFAKEIQSLKNSMMGGLNVTVSNIDELQ